MRPCNAMQISVLFLCLMFWLFIYFWLVYSPKQHSLWNYFRDDTQLKWFWHEKWRTQQRQSVQVIFGSVQCSGAEVWHTHIVPELAYCCECLSLLSATKAFSPSLKYDSPVWKITSPITPAASPLSVSPAWLMCWHGPQSHLRGKTESPESLLQFFFQKHDNRPRCQSLAFSPFLAQSV